MQLIIFAISLGSKNPGFTSSWNTGFVQELTQWVIKIDWALVWGGYWGD